MQLIEFLHTTATTNVLPFPVEDFTALSTGP